ncbi:hypothetical protein LINPERHAP1_LOCUS39707 [Linum perenne]
MEKSFSFLAMKRRLEFLWARSGPIQVSDMANNFFLVRFANKDDYTTATFQGPWKIYDYYITVSQWSPSFNEDEPIKPILMWVRLPKLSIQYFNSLAVQRFSNFIRRTVRLDLATSEGSRCRYARLCVEVDLTKPLLGKYMIEDKVLKIEYESHENVCFDCGYYGHKKGACPPMLNDNAVVTMVPPTKETSPASEEQVTGEWMTVQRRSRKRPTMSSKQPNQKEESGSRFSALQQVEPDAVSIPGMAGTEVQDSVPPVESGEKAQLAKLKKVLDEALAMADSSGPKPQRTVKMVLRDPLRDVSSTTPSVPTKTMSNASENSSFRLSDLTVSDEGIIPMKVVYQNPAFQTQAPPPKPSKAKAKVTQRNVGPRVKEPNKVPNLLVNKKRSFKKNASTPCLKLTVSDHDVRIRDQAVDTRKPPDRS